MHIQKIFLKTFIWVFMYHRYPDKSFLKILFSQIVSEIDKEFIIYTSVRDERKNIVILLSGL